MHTHVAHLKLLAAREIIIEREGSVDICYGDDIASKYLHLRTDDGLFGFGIIDISANGLYLSALSLVGILSAFYDIDKLAVDGIVQRFIPQQEVDNLKEGSILHGTAHAVGADILVGEEELVTGALFQPEQGCGQKLVAEGHRQPHAVLRPQREGTDEQKRDQQPFCKFLFHKHFVNHSYFFILNVFE